MRVSKLTDYQLSWTSVSRDGHNNHCYFESNIESHITAMYLFAKLLDYCRGYTGPFGFGTGFLEGTLGNNLNAYLFVGLVFVIELPPDNARET
jgi:hypothetical protein